MKPNSLFLRQNLGFWAIVKYVSEQGGYTNRKTRKNPISTFRQMQVSEIVDTLAKSNIQVDNIEDATLDLASLYLSYRAQILTQDVEPALMNREQARQCYNEVKESLEPTIFPTMNRQTGDKRHEAYLASMVAMYAEKFFGTGGFVNDAQRLCIIEDEGVLKGIFSRRFDGVIPSTRNPKVIWEIKEYYGTTTFGSRVADGVYETLLDGYEINAYESILKSRIRHYLFVDDRFTWWGMGKSYLCRMIDMLHTGHVDEIFFGKQVVTQWPVTLMELQKDLSAEGLETETKASGP